DVSYAGTLTVQDATGANRLEYVSGVLGVPEPATLSLFGLAMVGGFALIRRRACSQLKKGCIDFYRNSTSAMIRINIAGAMLLCLDLPSRAAVQLFVSSAPTNPVVGSNPTALAGYYTYTFTATDTDVTEKFIGFNFAAPLGIFDAMNQVNPAGQPTVF